MYPSEYMQDTCKIHQNTSGYVSTDRKPPPKRMGNPPAPLLVHRGKAARIGNTGERDLFRPSSQDPRAARRSERAPNYDVGSLELAVEETVVGGKPQRCMSRGIADTCIPYVSRMYPACIRIPHARYMYPNVSDMYPKFILDSFGIRVKYMQNIKIHEFSWNVTGHLRYI